jgi:FkbM family methyltransferase
MEPVKEIMEPVKQLSATRSVVRQAALRLPLPLLTAMHYATVRPLRAYIRYAPWAFGKTLLWNRMISHFRWLESSREPTAEARTFFGSTILVDPQDMCGRFIYYFGTWEPNLTHWISQRLKDGDVFVDVGANVGYFSLLASTLVGSGHVVAVEPTPRAFDMLQESMRRSRVTNVRAVNAAAWHERSVLQMFSGANLTMSSLMSDWAARWNDYESCDVPADRLADILTPQEMKSARIVKIDVEGAEWHVIEGMVELLESCREDLEIMVEVTPKLLAAEQHTSDELFELFGRYGFRPYILENDYSPLTYCAPSVPRSPRRITSMPADCEQADIIFSRR